MHNNEDHEKELEMLRSRFSVIRSRLHEDIKASPLSTRYKEDDAKASRISILLHVHQILKHGLTYLFLMSAIALSFVFLMLGKMIYNYVEDLILDPIRLEAQLAHIWTVLSGAFVVVFFQFVVSTSKRLVNGNEKH